MDADEIGDLNLPATGCLPNDDSSQINISDVIEVIQTTDPTSALAMFTTNATGGQQQQQSGTGATTGVSGGHQMRPSLSHENSQGSTSSSVSGQPPQGLSSGSNSSNIRRTAYVKITEQPASKALRFRYECEGRSAGSIPGINSTPENKTFPSIQVVGYKGRAVVVVSCVTKDPPYRPHPHNLVGKEGCKKGVCTVEINSETMTVIFSNLGIQCVKKKDIEEALRVREEIRVDPFRTGFSHRNQPSSIDLNAVRLCFQVFLESDQRGRFTVPLPPVVSDPIYDKKAMSDLVICKLSDCSCTVAGGKEIILLCEKVAKEDISVRFFEEQDGQIVWEGYGDFQHTNVHKQVAISFRTPRYRVLEVDQPIKMYIQLKRPSDGATSEALPFDYYPLDSDPAELKRKRQKLGGEASAHLFRHFQAQEHHQRHNLQQQQQQSHTQDGRSQQQQQQQIGFLNISTDSSIKTEPRDTSPLPYMFSNTTNYRVPQASPSPQPLSPATPVYNPSSTPSPYSLTPGGSTIPPNGQYGAAGINPTMLGNFSNMQSYQQSPFANYNPQQLQQHPQQQQQQIQQGSNQPVTQQTPQPQWNMPPTTSVGKHIGSVNNLNTNSSFSIDNLTHVTTTGLTDPMIPSNLSSLLDMDSQQLTQFNSAELSGISLSLLDGHYAPGTSNSASISQQLEATIKQEQQLKMDTEQENMTDSFTRLTTATINELTDLNNMMYNTRNINNH